MRWKHYELALLGLTWLVVSMNGFALRSTKAEEHSQTD